MRPKLLTVKNGKIAINIWYKENLNPKIAYRFLIFCHGLPSHPYQLNPAKVEEYIEKGFVLVYPDYIGTWASDGVMSWENCVETVMETISFLKKGTAKSVYDGSIHKWSVKDIGLVGGSFGASIVMVTGAKSKDINNIVAVAGPTNWRNHSKIPEEVGESIDELYYAIMSGWKNLWRIPSRKEWDRLVNGEADINPIDYIKKLKEKNLMLIHGTMDDVVSYKRSEDLYKNIKDGPGYHKLLLLKNKGHLGGDVIGDSEVVNEVMKFLSKNK